MPNCLESERSLACGLDAYPSRHAIGALHCRQRLRAECPSREVVGCYRPCAWHHVSGVYNIKRARLRRMIRLVSYESDFGITPL